ncbi:MAG: hypothetical protein AUI47_08595, partial [Acidobacteria bacterium 13_1_40CM_2_68_5]
AVNPSNPRNIVIAANDLPSIFGNRELPGNLIDDDGDGLIDEAAVSTDTVWVTTDGGVTWNRQVIPLPAAAPAGTTVHGDPTIAFNRDGSRLVYVHMADKTPASHGAGPPNERHAMVSAVSLDGGVTWLPANAGIVGDATLVAGVPRAFTLDEDGDTVNDANDKEYLAVGPDFANPAQDRFVVAWQRHHVIYASTSLNGVVWSVPVQVGGETRPTPTSAPAGGHSIDSIPTVGPNGEIYIVWEEFGTAGQSRIKFDRSLDGGAHWATAVGVPDTVIYTGSINPFNDPFSLGQYNIPAQPTRGIWLGLSADVDRSGGPHHGRLYVAFADQADRTPGSVNAADHDNTDIFVIASDDLGATWTALGATPVRVSDDPGINSQFFSWLDVDQRTGNVGVSWYDARNAGAANNTVQYFAAVSFDGGATFSPNVLISNGASNPLLTGGGNDFGDYTGMAFDRGVVHMAWADISNSTGNNADPLLAPPRPIRNEVYYDRALVNGVSLAGIEAAVVSGKSLNAAGFSGPVVFNTGTPQWVEQGPGPAVGGYTRIGDGDVVGAIQAVAAHPTNRNIIFIGAANGGVWRTTTALQGSDTVDNDNDGLRDEPDEMGWKPVTDQFPSLSINAIAFDLNDPSIVYAGTGSSSSFKLEGGMATGLLKSTNGGDTWRLVGQSTLRNEVVTGIVARGNIVVVSTARGGGQLYRSTDGGDNFNRLSMNDPLMTKTGLITGATRANPVVITSPGHTLSSGDHVRITGVLGMTQLNGRDFVVTVINPDSFSLTGENGTGHTAYTSAGIWTLDDEDGDGLINEVGVLSATVPAPLTGPITGAAQANPVVITAAGHLLSNGDRVRIAGIVGMTQLNDRDFTVTVINANSFSLNGENGTAHTAYTSGGTWSLNRAGRGYAAGDVLTANVPGGGGVVIHRQAQFEVLAVDADGKVTAVALTDPGEYEGVTNTIVSPTGGTVGSTGLRLDIRFSRNEFNLPVSGPVSELVAVPPAAAAASFTVYAAFGSQGVFRSTDSGLHWTNVTGNIPQAILRDSVRVRLAVSINDTVYAAVASNGGRLVEATIKDVDVIKIKREGPFFIPLRAGDKLNILGEEVTVDSVNHSNPAFTLVELTSKIQNVHPIGTLVTADISGRLSAIYRSGDGGKTWRPISLPGDDEKGGIHNGGHRMTRTSFSSEGTPRRRPTAGSSAESTRGKSSVTTERTGRPLSTTVPTTPRHIPTPATWPLTPGTTSSRWTTAGSSSS